MYKKAVKKTKKVVLTVGILVLVYLLVNLESVMYLKLD